MELFSQLKLNNKLQGKLGLKNYGDSSFVNAIVQAISNVEPVCFAIRELPIDLPKSIGSIEDVSERTKRMDIFFALRRILRELWKDKRMVIEPAILLRRMNAVELLKDSISNKSIEDTFLYLLEALHDALMQPVPPQFESRVNFKPASQIWDMMSLFKDIEGDYKKSLERDAREDLAYHRSIISDAFQGIIIATVNCPHCGFIEQTLDPFFSMSLDIVCHDDKAAKKRALKSDFVVSASSLDIHSKRSRKIYTDNSKSEKSSKTVNSRLKSGGKASVLSSTHIKTKPNPAPLPSRDRAKVVPIEEAANPSFDVVTESDTPDMDICDNKNTPTDGRKVSGLDPAFNLKDNFPNRKALKPISTQAGYLGSSKKYKKYHNKGESKKRRKARHDDISDNIDDRIDLELSQSSSESNPNIECRNNVVNDVVSNAKVEEAKSITTESHKKMAMDVIANKRQQRQHHKNLRTLTSAEIGAKHKRKQTLHIKEGSLQSIQSLSKQLKRTGKQLSSTFASQARLTLDMHGMGQRVILHDCIRSHLADEVVHQHNCASCGQASDVTKKKRISNAPEVIVFCFKRFIKSGFFQTKDNTLVSFPMENFDISDFVEMSSGYFKGSWDQRAVYDLQVLVCHLGNDKDSNRYSTMARHDPEGKWFEYHDHRVRVVSKRYVASREALMLFYIRKKTENNMSSTSHSTLVANLQNSVRGAVLDRREAVVDELNYLHHMDRIHQVNLLKKTLTEKNNRLVRSVRKSLHSSVKLITHLRKSVKIFGGSEIKRDEVPWTSDTSPIAGRKDLLSLASFVEVAMGEANIIQKKRILGPGWRLVKKSLQKIVMLGRDPSLCFDNAHIILEIPPTKHIFVSIYWLIKFLSFSEPGPLCNHDIVCCHGGLKPHLYSCRKRICIPIAIDLFRSLRDFVKEKYGYPTCLLPTELSLSSLDKGLSSEIIFRELKSTIPCNVCISHHDELMRRRKEERERVVMESIKDGFEEDLLPDEDAIRVRRLVQLEKKRREVEISEKQRAESVEDKAKLRILENDKSPTFEKSPNTFVTADSFAASPILDKNSVSIRPADEITYYYVVSKSWVESWRRFCLAGRFEDIEFPFSPPGPINNFDLLLPGSSHEIKTDLVIDQDYIVVSPGVWHVLHDIYGGGPVLQREDVSIYSAHCGPSIVGMIVC